MRIALAGEGAIGTQHLAALAKLDQAELALLVGGVEATTRRAAERFGVPRWTLRLEDALADPAIEAVILATPTPLHARQGIACLEAGKHVLVEIPMADSLADAERLVEARRRAGRVGMVNHLRRFNRGHAALHRRLRGGELRLHHLVVQTRFMRRTNTNLLGEPRSWTDSLLWHHACHTVDLFLHQTGETASVVQAVAGPPSPTLGIPLDMAVILATPSGVLLTLSLSFNDAGPPGTFFRYICEEGTFLATGDDLTDGAGEPVATGDADPADGIERVDRAFLEAARSGAEPPSSLEQGLAAMRVLDRIERALAGRGQA